MNKQPTKEQIQWFWEQCGWEYKRCNPHHFEDNPAAQERDMSWWHKDCSVGFRRIPGLDLNNLFKYAVQFLEYVDISWQPYLHSATVPVASAFIRTMANKPNKNIVGGVEVRTGDSNPTLALFWAIFKALGGKE